eukprot:SAG31_NODE_3213_length_4543_cov_1.531503_2_plen_414_part_00
MATDSDGCDEYSRWPAVLQDLARSHKRLDEAADDGTAHKADLSLSALGGCISYLREHLIDSVTVSLKNFHKFVPYDAVGSAAPTTASLARQPRHMVLDSNSLANLEIIVDETGESRGSLLGHLDHCVTQGGKRLFKKWLQAPLYRPAEIEQRLDAVDELLRISDVSQSVAKGMRKFPDFERLLAQIHVIGTRDDEHPMSRAVMYYDINKKRTDALKQALAGFKDLAQLIRRYDEDVTRLHGGLQSAALIRLLRVDETDTTGSCFPDIAGAVAEFEGKVSFTREGALEPKPGVDEGFDGAVHEINAITKQLDRHLSEVREELGCHVQYYHNVGERYQLEVSLKDGKKISDDYEIKSSTKSVRRFYTGTVANLMEELDVAEKAKKDAEGEFIKGESQFQKNTLSFRHMAMAAATP